MCGSWEAEDCLLVVLLVERQIKTLEKSRDWIDYWDHPCPALLNWNKIPQQEKNGVCKTKRIIYFDLITND